MINQPFAFVRFAVWRSCWSSTSAGAGHPLRVRSWHHATDSPEGLLASLHTAHYYARWSRLNVTSSIWYLFPCPLTQPPFFILRRRSGTNWSRVQNRDVVEVCSGYLCWMATWDKQSKTRYWIQHNQNHAFVWYLDVPLIKKRIRRYKNKYKN